MPLEVTLSRSEIVESSRSDLLIRGKSARDDHASGGCSTPLGRVQTDPASREKIFAAMQMAVVSQLTEKAYSVVWTMEDNSNVEHSAEQVVEMCFLVGKHVTSCHETWLVKKQKIKSAATLEELRAIDLEEGYPT